MSQRPGYLHIDLAPIKNTKRDGLVGGGERGGEDRVKGKEVEDASCTPLEEEFICVVLLMKEAPTCLMHS